MITSFFKPVPKPAPRRASLAASPLASPPRASEQRGVAAAALPVHSSSGWHGAQNMARPSDPATLAMMMSKKRKLPGDGAAAAPLELPGVEKKKAAKPPFTCSDELLG